MSENVVNSTFPENSPIFAFRNEMMWSIQNAAPEKAGQLQATLARHKVRFVLDQNTDAVFRAREADGRKDICCSIYGAEALWAAAMAYVSVHRHFKENVGRTLLYADNPATKDVPGLLDFAFNRRIARRSTEPWPSTLPGPRSVGPGEEAGTVHLATHVWLLGLAWILHHELAHVDLGHLDRADCAIDDEISADERATDWLIGGVVAPDMRLARSLGIATAAVVLVGLSLHRHHRSIIGRRTHPPAGERLLRALSHREFEDDHPAQELAAVGVKMHLDSIGINAPDGPFETSSDCLSAYCRLLIDWELRRD